MTLTVTTTELFATLGEKEMEIRQLRQRVNELLQQLATMSEKRKEAPGVSNDRQPARQSRSRVRPE